MVDGEHEFADGMPAGKNPTYRFDRDSPDLNTTGGSGPPKHRPQIQLK
jgi:hypothetical protein